MSNTGTLLRRGRRRQTVGFGSLPCIVDVPGWYPDSGDDAVHSGTNLRGLDEAFRVMRESYAAHVSMGGERLKLEEAGVIIDAASVPFRSAGPASHRPTTRP